VVRSTEVRGHLRFWWRATRGGAFGGNLEKMKQREEEIWGSPGGKGKGGREKPGPSKVSITIAPGNRGNAFQAKDRRGENIRNIGNPNSLDGYVAFPLRESDAHIVLENVDFEITIRFPKEITVDSVEKKVNIEKDIEFALWAWETFGGIGARTRRGFGALQCVELNGMPITGPKKAEIKNLIQQYLSAELKWPSGIPHLSSNLNRYKPILRDQGSTAISVWRELIKQLQEFRQFRNGRFGRSLWPEPDQIRRETGDFVNPKHTPKHPVKKFPRGKFGLPIIFEFKKEDVRDGDPKKTTLQGAEHDRLASPLILRPITCSDGVVGLATILEWQPINPGDESYTPPGGLMLTGKDYGDFPEQGNLNAAEAKDIPPLNLSGKPQPDVLQAFLDSLK